MTKLPYQPHEFSQIYPPASMDDFRALKQSLLADGLQDAIELFEGKALDGNQRQRGCAETGVEPRYTEFKGTQQEALKHVYNKNRVRRHLTPHEKQVSFLKYLKLEESITSDNKSPGGQSVPERAADFGVGRTSAYRLKKLDEHGTDEEKAAFQSGDVNLKKVDAQIAQREKQWYDSPLRDAEGHPIPEGDASYYWNRRVQAEEFLALVVKAGKFAKTLDQDDVMWINMDVNTVLSELRSVAHRIRSGAIPRHVCLGCNGVKPVKCQHCKGRGVVPDIVWGHEPEEKRKAREHA
jgi:hypothetical protein